jgi:exosortase
VIVSTTPISTAGTIPSTPPSSSQTRSVGWRDAAAAAALAVAAILVLLQAWRDIYRIGSIDEECSYVLLAPIVIGALVYVRRDALAGARYTRGWTGLAVLGLGWIVYRYGFVHDPFLWRAGAVVVLAGSVMTAVGWDVSRRMWPALLACLFLIPVDPTGRLNIALPLQVVTADATQKTCDVVGIAAQRSGNMLSINGIDVTVAEACNGIRMILTLFMVCYVAVFMLRLGPVTRLIGLAATPVVAVVSNVVRLVPTLWMFGHRPLATAERFHDASGWVMTVLAFLVLVGVLSLFQPPRPDRPQRAAS